jgi:GxxExxY protein
MGEVTRRRNIPQITQKTQMNQYPEEEYPHRELTEQIIGAAMEVHRVLGHGFTEPVYQEALALELALREIPFSEQTELRIFYKGRELKKTFRSDFVVFEKVVVELKASSRLVLADSAQVLNYLKATALNVGLLLNFGVPSLEIKRVARTESSAKSAKSADSD